MYQRPIVCFVMKVSGDVRLLSVFASIYPFLVEGLNVVPSKRNVVHVFNKCIWRTLKCRQSLQTLSQELVVVKPSKKKQDEKKKTANSGNCVTAYNQRCSFVSTPFYRQFWVGVISVCSVLFLYSFGVGLFKASCGLLWLYPSIHSASVFLVVCTEL